MQNLLKDCAIDVVKAAVAAGTTNITDAAEVDMAGYDGVCFIAVLGALTAGQVTKLQAQGGATSGSHAELAGATTAAAADADSDKALAVEVFRPVHRFVKPVLVRGTANAALNAIIAIRYRGSKVPVALGATVSKVVSAVSPATV